MDALTKIFDQLGQNDLTGDQVSFSFVSNPVLLSHALDLHSLTDFRLPIPNMVLPFDYCFLCFLFIFGNSVYVRLTFICLGLHPH